MISVAIVDTCPDVRKGVERIVNAANDMCCTACYAAGTTAMQMLNTLRPDVVLLDIDLPDMNGSALIRMLTQDKGILVLVCSKLTDDQHVFDALEAGAHGYLSKAEFPLRIKKAIREVVEGGAPMSPAIARRVVGSFSRKEKIEELSERENQVLDLLCHGQSYKEIATTLFVSTNTVRFHIKNIYKKLDVKSRHEAMLLLNRAGVL